MSYFIESYYKKSLHIKLFNYQIYTFMSMFLYLIKQTTKLIGDGSVREDLF